jgi:hypothetical protein
MMPTSPKLASAAATPASQDILQILRAHHQYLNQHPLCSVINPYRTPATMKLIPSFVALDTPVPVLFGIMRVYHTDHHGTTSTAT